VDQLRTNPSLQYVLLIARWTEYPTTRLNKTALARTVDGLIRLGLKTTIVRQMPEPKDDVPRFFALSKRWPMLPLPITPTWNEHQQRRQRLDGLLANLDASCAIIDPSLSFFLNGELAVLQHDNRPLYFGAIHLSSYGAIHAAEAMPETFRQVAQP